MNVLYGVREGNGWAWEIRPHVGKHQLYTSIDINAAYTYCDYLKMTRRQIKSLSDDHFHVEERFEAL